MMKIRILAAVFLLSLSFTAYAQKSMFVRVHDLSGKQINKGHVTMATDTALQLNAKPIAVNIPVGSIGYIKTGRAGLWFSQNGANACRVCPLIITDTRAKQT